MNGKANPKNPNPNPRIQERKTKNPRWSGKQFLCKGRDKRRGAEYVHGLWSKLFCCND